MSRFALVTQSYKNDYPECRLLCESIDQFAPGIAHFIFVNDEDMALFRNLEYGNHRIYPKSSVLPWHMVRIPFRILGHHFHVSPFSIPVREWIMQQICKLGVFDIIGDEFDAVFHIDSESVFMRPLDPEQWVKDGAYSMYRQPYVDEPSHFEYCKAARRLLRTGGSVSDISRYNYMGLPACFVRENTQALLAHIKRNSPFRNWKLALCNTYRFSEYYTYGIYTDRFLSGKNHFIRDYRLLPVVDISLFSNGDEFDRHITGLLADGRYAGLTLQKVNRRQLSDRYLDFGIISHTVRNYWATHFTPAP